LGRVKFSRDAGRFFGRLAWEKGVQRKSSRNAAFPNSPERADVHALLTVLVAGKKATDFVFTRKTASRKSMISGINGLRSGSAPDWGYYCAGNAAVRIGSHPE
jgi:hypothetical protein